MQLLLSPVVAMLALFLFGIAIPLVEEAFKTLAGGVAARWSRPQPARAFLWGVAGGAGFALAENVFNGALGGVETWPLAALARLAATVMHCATGGLVGWGWGQFWTARRPRRFLASYLAAVAVHGLWNGVTVILVLLSAGTVMYEGDALWGLLGGAGAVALLGLLALLAAASVGWLVFAVRRLAAQGSGEEGQS
jgi:RsiW-degrading membrane proteinase PrsW (M82 family)